MDGMDNLLMTYRDMTTRDWLVDAAVALAAFAVGCLQLMLTASSIIIPDLALRQYLGVVNVVPDLQVFVGLGMTVVPLVLRRRFPLPVFAACLVIFLGLQVRFSGFSMTVVGPLVALYTVAAECGTVPGIACGAAAVLSLLFAGAPMQAASMVFFTRFQNIALMVAAVLAGYAYRTHVAYVRAVEQRAAEAERTREEEAARRVEEERVRIAREVHDITAHSLSAVSIQLAAAERLVERDPRMAKEAVSTARATAKAALDDIRSMIGVLLTKTGASDQIVDTVVAHSSKKSLPWAIAAVAFIMGISLFFEVGLVLMIPVVMSLAKRQNMPAIALGIPAIAALGLPAWFCSAAPGPSDCHLVLER